RVATSAGPAVFFASGFASPIGLITRVPAESDGGLLWSSASVQVGKSQALAAGATLGPLGDAFVVTSVPAQLAPYLPAIPAQVYAQDPPSDLAPRVNSFKQSVNTKGARGLALNAATAAGPQSSSNATAAGLNAVIVSTGASTSQTTSEVSADGSVTSTATTST